MVDMKNAVAIDFLPASHKSYVCIVFKQHLLSTICVCTFSKIVNTYKKFQAYRIVFYSWSRSRYF